MVHTPYANGHVWGSDTAMMWASQVPRPQTDKEGHTGWWLLAPGTMAGMQVGLHGAFLDPQVRSVPELDSDSDSEGLGSGSVGPGSGSLPHSQVIHSGHFMVSSPHSDLVPRRRHHHSEPEPADPRTIDPTLTRLFECMSLAYSGKLVSPKWKNFKGLRLLCRDKIRLNNAIWRAWYIQYVEQRKSLVCGFVTPLEGSEADEHRKPEAVVLEGNYWKRRIEVVMKEYHKWRIYYKKRLRKSSREGEVSGPKQDESVWKPSEKWCNQLFSNVVPMLLGNENEEARGRQLFDLDSFLSDISDTLFTMTQPPCPHLALPEDAYTGNADMIQPGLTPLQPNLDDFMEISDLFSHRPLPSQVHVSYQEQPCFTPMADSLYSSSALPASHASPLMASRALPATYVNATVPPNGHLQSSSSSSSQLSLPGSFLSPDFPPAPRPTDSQAGLCTDLKHKPPLQYGLLSKSLGMEPYGPSYCAPAAPPSAFLLGQAPLYPPASAPRTRFHFSSSTGPSLLSHTASSLSTPCFTQQAPGLGASEDLLPAAYPALSSAQPLPPGMLSSPRFVSPKGQLPPGGSRPVMKSASTKAKRPPGLPVPTPCLTQLLTAAKPELSLDPPATPSTSFIPTSPSFPDGGLAEVPSGFLPHMAHLSPGLSPGSSPSQSVPITRTVVQPGSLLVPKREQLSPPAACASDWPKPGQVSPVPAGGLTAEISPPHSAPSRGRLPESNKTESRRITHISAEQKRRFNIKLGFDTLHGLVSTLSAQPSIKVSKATTLQKTAEYICKLQQERAALQDEAQRLRGQIEELNAAINLCQQQLPATGVPITRQRFDQMRDMFDEYVRSCTLQNWKFWVFSIIIRPLFESFNGMVSTASMESLRHTCLAWLDQHCSLPALRPTVLNSLRQLSISTSILTDPACVPEQATLAVMGTGPSNNSS